MFAFGFSKKHNLSLLLIEGWVLDQCRANERLACVDAHLCLGPGGCILARQLLEWERRRDVQNPLAAIAGHKTRYSVTSYGYSLLVTRYQKWAALFFGGMRFPLVRYHFFRCACASLLPFQICLFSYSGSFRYALSYPIRSSAVHEPLSLSYSYTDYRIE
jgi:hypothetical protein